MNSPSQNNSNVKTNNTIALKINKNNNMHTPNNLLHTNNNIIRLTNNTTNKKHEEKIQMKKPLLNINSKSKEKEKETKVLKMERSKGKENKIINNKSKDKDNKVILLNGKIKDNKIINLNKNKDNNKVIILNKAKAKDTTKITMNSKSQPKEKESILNKINMNKNITNEKKGHKSPNPGNAILKKKILVGNPKPKQTPVIKISPSKLPKDKINSTKIRLNTDNIIDSKKQMNKTITNRKVEKSPVSLKK